jgi:hypothetical protein
MTYEHSSGSGHPASPDVDMGVPEVCMKCEDMRRDCPEPCGAFLKLELLKSELESLKSLIKTQMESHPPLVMGNGNPWTQWWFDTKELLEAEKE